MGFTPALEPVSQSVCTVPSESSRTCHYNYNHGRPIEYYEKNVGNWKKTGMTQEEWRNKQPTSASEAIECYKKIAEEQKELARFKLPEIDWKKHWATGKKYYKTYKPLILNKYTPWVILGIIFFIRIIQFNGG